jgi:hypothetical protein
MDPRAGGHVPSGDHQDQEGSAMDSERFARLARTMRGGMAQERPTATTRRTVVRTGAKLAYAAPLVAASFTLSATHAAAVSPVGPGAACRQIALEDATVGNFEVFNQCMAPADCRNGSQGSIQAGGEVFCQRPDSSQPCAKEDLACAAETRGNVCRSRFDRANSAANLTTIRCQAGNAGCDRNDPNKVQCRCDLAPLQAGVACRCVCQAVLNP